MDNTNKPINHLSLCSGYSGIGLGLKRVLPSLREIAHVESDAYAVALLVKKMESGYLVPAPIWTELKSFNFSAFRGSMEQGLLSGGFPCQPFSQAGSRRSTEDPRHLFPYIIGGIKECRPAVVFLENVAGIITAETTGGESVLKHCLSNLEALGYIVTAGLFSAAEVGAPHQRKRVFIMGKRKDLADPDSCRGGKDFKQPELWATSIIKSSRGSWVRSEQEEAPQGSKGLAKRFPARPGENQYEWEEPRTVERGLVRTNNGTASRVDRLRLLGNGVVPQTVEKAFITLLTELNKLKQKNKIQ